MLYVLATLKNGEQVISEFEELRGIRTLASDVMSGRKAFPVWRKVGDTHPVSGEAVTLRTREFISGTEVARMQVVEPIIEDHDFDPANFRPAVQLKSGRYGIWTAPEDEDERPEGIEAGTQFPVHRDLEQDNRRYVILQVARDGADEVRYYIDPEAHEESMEWDDVEDEMQDVDF